jgi:hypothetical protein
MAILPKNTMNMKYKILIGLVVLLPAAIISQTPSPNRSADAFRELVSTVEKQLKSTGATNAAGALGDIHKAGVEFIDHLALSEQDKTKFVFEHLNEELLEMRKHELVIKILLKRLLDVKTEERDYKGVIDFLGRPRTGSIDSALCAVFVKSQIMNEAKFTNGAWWPALTKQLNGDETGKSVLAQDLLDRAKDEHWNNTEADGTYVPKWTPDEEQEISRSIGSIERRVLALRYLSEKNHN